MYNQVDNHDNGNAIDMIDTCTCSFKLQHSLPIDLV